MRPPSVYRVVIPSSHDHQDDECRQDDECLRDRQDMVVPVDPTVCSLVHNRRDGRLDVQSGTSRSATPAAD